jgi:hypothetical protein
VNTFPIEVPGLPARCHYCGAGAAHFPLAVAEGGELILVCPNCHSRIGEVVAVPEGALTRVDPEAWPPGVRFGELTPAQRAAAVKRAGADLSAELARNADAIAEVLLAEEEEERPDPLRELARQVVDHEGTSAHPAGHDCAACRALRGEVPA